MNPLIYNIDFLKLYSGRIITNIGDSFYFIASMWLVYEVSGSGFLTGVASAAFFLPTTLQFAIGPLVDRADIRSLLGASQFVQAVVVLLVPISIWAGVFSVWIILAILPTLAFLNQVTGPAQTKALQRITSESQYTSASSAFATASEAIDFVANAIGGLLIAFIGVTAVYLVDSLTFVLAMVLFLSIRDLDVETDSSPNNTLDLSGYLEDLREGFEFLRSSVIFPLMIPAIVANLAIGATAAILPAFAAEHGSAISYGFLYSAMGAGMLIGSIVTPFLKERRSGITVIWTFGCSTIAWVLSMIVPWTVVTVVLFGIAWISPGIYNVIEDTILLKTVPEDTIGRVRSFTMSISMLSLPIGSLLGGMVVSVIGTRPTLLALSAGFGFVAVFFAAHSELRRLDSLTAIKHTAG
ncbi:macrolide-efflux protein [Natrinema thermotolerans DSM 11552]|nr:macrolide-efflux protein [Natrinema thermotolerans DSM 11552]